MKKLLIILAFSTLFVLVFAGSAFAFHMPDAAGRTCFRCHSTHAGADTLLLNTEINNRDVVSDFGVVTASTVCLACHDGTGHYVSVTGLNNNNMLHSGLFDLEKWPSDATENFSAHTVDIAADYFKPISSAPGNDNKDYYNNLNETLNCASCHNPHGNYDNVHAYLKVNPNDSIDGKFKSTDSDWSAKLAQKEEAVEITLERVGAGVYENTASAPWLRAYRLARGAVDNHYVKYPVAVQIGGTWVFNQTVNPTATNFSVNALTGAIRFDQAVADPGVSQLTAKVFQPIMVEVVDTFDGKILDAAGNEQTIADVRIYSDNVNRWCGACHSDYDIRSRAGDTYEAGGATLHGHNVYRGWNQSYATPYSSDNTSNCLTCHYAHGTRSDIMLDTNKQIIGDRTYPNHRGEEVRFVDTSPANKRYFGGSVCVVCHYDSHGYGFMWNNELRPESFQWQ